MLQVASIDCKALQSYLHWIHKYQHQPMVYQKAESSGFLEKKNASIKTAEQEFIPRIKTSRWSLRTKSSRLHCTFKICVLDWLDGWMRFADKLVIFLVNCGTIFIADKITKKFRFFSLFVKLRSSRSHMDLIVRSYPHNCNYWLGYNLSCSRLF